MAGRRDFLKRFGIGIAAAPVAVQVAQAALTATAKVEPILKAGDVVAYKPVAPAMPDYLRHMQADPYCVTSTVCMTFHLPKPSFVNMAEVNRRSRA